jgi:hypothetical protein
VAKKKPVANKKTVANKKKRAITKGAADKQPLERLDRPVTLTGQVEQTLRRAIAEDVFPGDRLPTTVKLADQLVHHPVLILG